MEEAKMYCFQCVNNDDLFAKYRINKALRSFCKIGMKKKKSCLECKKKFCSNCGSSSIHRCTYCSQNIAKQSHKDAIHSTVELLDKYLIDIIASYSIGNVVHCNNNISCSNVILFNNDADFENNIDSFGRI